MSAVRNLLTDLVGINSVNPLLDPTNAGEGSLSDFIYNYCRSRDIACSFGDVEGKRRNVLASVPGSSKDVLLFVSHLDTVPSAGWDHDPFRARVANNRLYGRGACDDKGSLAAMLVALDGIKTEKPRATIVVAGSVDEEVGKKGALALAATQPRFTAAVVGEPTDLELIVAHNGSARWQVEIIGRAAHSSIPEKGESAITPMAEVLIGLRDLGSKLRTRVTALTGAPSLTVSRIEGGSDWCTVPARCVISIDRRLVPGETAAEAVAEVGAVLNEVQARNPNVICRSMTPIAKDSPVSGAVTTRLADIARAACLAHGGTGDYKGVTYGTDASKLSEAGIPCIILGPGSIAQAHAIDEYVDLDQLEKSVQIYRSIMLNY